MHPLSPCRVCKHAECGNRLKRTDSDLLRACESKKNTWKTQLLILIGQTKHILDNILDSRHDIRNKTGRERCEGNRRRHTFISEIPAQWAQLEGCWLPFAWDNTNGMEPRSHDEATLLLPGRRTLSPRGNFTASSEFIFHHDWHAPRTELMTRVTEGKGYVLQVIATIKLEIIFPLSKQSDDRGRHSGPCQSFELCSPMLLLHSRRSVLNDGNRFKNTSQSRPDNDK